MSIIQTHVGRHGTPTANSQALPRSCFLVSLYDDDTLPFLLRYLNVAGERIISTKTTTGQLLRFWACWILFIPVNECYNHLKWTHKLSPEVYTASAPWSSANIEPNIQRRRPFVYPTINNLCIPIFSARGSLTEQSWR